MAVKNYIVILLLLAAVFQDAQAQSRRADRPQVLRQAQTAAKDTASLMQYIVDENGDMVYLDEIDPVYKVAVRKGREWRRYYRLVHNFAKAYPYALLAEEKLSEADSTITTDGLRRGKRNRYINILQKELFETFEKPLRNLTVSQGKLLLRLIDRQTGITPYEIINEYKGRAAAGFWQGIAKLFGSDMKLPYDPEGADRQTEELVILYQKGEFNVLYRSVFGQNPPEPVVRSRLDVAQR